MLSERGPKPLSLQDAKDAIGIGEALPIVEPEGLKVHRVVFVGLFDLDGLVGVVAEFHHLFHACVHFSCRV